MPRRVQLSRKKGWRKPEGAIVVARPSRWGNPYRIGEHGASRADTVRRFERYRHDEGYPSDDEVRAELAGHDLACWCPLDEPCHADVLLGIANGKRTTAARK